MKYSGYIVGTFRFKARRVLMTTEVEIVSGSEILRFINSIEGTWQQRLEDATSEYKDRGRMMAHLRRRQVVQGNTVAVEGTLEDAGFTVERALFITGQPDNYRGRLGAVRLLLEALRLNACPTYLKRGRCWKRQCRLNHGLPRRSVRA